MSVRSLKGSTSRDDRETGPRRKTRQCVTTLSTSEIEIMSHQV